MASPKCWHGKIATICSECTTLSMVLNQTKYLVGTPIHLPRKVGILNDNMQFLQDAGVYASQYYVPRSDWIVKPTNWSAETLWAEMGEAE